MKKRFITAFFIYSLIFAFVSNSFILVKAHLKSLFLILPLFIFSVALAGILGLKSRKLRLRICYHGIVLLSAFCISVYLSIIYHIVLAFITIPDSYTDFLWSALCTVILNAVVFWIGIICVYVCSFQLGLKKRVIGIICGLIPVANLIVLFTLIGTVFEEVKFEYEKEIKNQKRKDMRVCETRYPILMVHGFFFRDYKYFDYWGRIPDELRLNGAEIYYGNHQSALKVCESAQELSVRIKEILEQTGAEKVNIIAHSKGGLDCRYAVSKLGMAPYVASLTTVNTPHRGCEFADYLLTKIPQGVQDKVASTYNAAMRKLGDEHPDFLAAVDDLTASSCQSFNSEIGLEVPDGIYCQSVGTILKKASGGKFPLNFSYHLVKHFDGPNDGLVSSSSFEWGEKFTLLKPRKNAGISHGDIIDLNRMNLKDFDVREFYVQLVNDLKNKGF